MLTLFLIVLFLWLFAVTWRKSRSRLNLPPGPNPIFPLIGNLPQLFKYRYLDKAQMCEDLNKKYGSILFLDLGRAGLVNVQDLTLVKKLLSSKEFVGRYSDAVFYQMSTPNLYGLVFNSGECWKELRHFAIKTLKDFGFGKKSSVENALAFEISEMFRVLDEKSENRQELMVWNFFSASVLNILWGMVSGSRFAHDDPRLAELFQGRDDILGEPLKSVSVDSIPLIGRLFKKPQKLEARKVSFRNLRRFFKETIVERRMLGNFKVEPKDFFDVFLAEIDARKHSSGETNHYTDAQLVAVCIDLFNAGSDTTSNTLEFAILYMTLNLQVQKKVQQEIDTIVGKTAKLTLDMKTKLPYTEATILEVMRLGNVIPSTVRGTNEDTTIAGYHIPKGTTLGVCLERIHKSKLYWDDPEDFRPERFLDPSTGSIIHADKILPFGYGKRVCIGESLARSTTFFFFASLLQRYSISASTQHPLPHPLISSGVVRSPKPFYAVFRNR